MIKVLLKYKSQIIILATGVFWLIIINKLMHIENQNNICNDCDNYRESASYLYNNFKAHYFRPIGMAIITGLPYLFGFKDDCIFKFSLIINILSWLGSSLLLFSFLNRQYSNKIAFLASLSFFSILSYIFIDFQLLTESIYTFLTISFFYFLNKYYNEKKSFHYLSIALSVLFFSILIKPSLKFFALLIFIIYFKILIQNYKNRSIILIYLSLTLIAFQYIKMKKDYGNYTLSYIDSVTYYNYLGSKAFYYKTNKTLNQNFNLRAEYIAKFKYPKQREIANKDILIQLKNNKVNLIKAYISNLIDNTKSSNSSIETIENINKDNYFGNFKKFLIIISKYQNRFFTLTGFILSLYFIKKSLKKENLYILMSIYILYTILISGISCSQGDRFHIVFFPFVIILIIKFYFETLELQENKFNLKV